MSDQAVVGVVAASGARYMRVNLDWAISEPIQGELSFNSRNDRVIQRVEESGLRLFPTLYVGNGWMTGSVGEEEDLESRSYPPSDLTEAWDDTYGHSRTYFEFVRRFFLHYQGHFDFVAIENEANSELFWGGTAEEYVLLLRTAYMAIKDADPKVVVVDSGSVSSALGLCAVQDELDIGRLSESEVLEAAKLYYSAKTGSVQVADAADLERALTASMTREQCRRVNLILDNAAGSVDAINFHFYEDYRAMPFMLNWLRWRTERAGYQPSFITNELGVRGPGIVFAESSRHAEEVAKKLVIADSLDLGAVVWFSADTIQRGRDKVGLFGEDGSVRPAGRAFQIVSGFLGRDYRFREVGSLGPSLYHFQYEDLAGRPAMEALWVEGLPIPMTLKAPQGSTAATIVQISGSRTYLPAIDGKVDLQLTESPVFLLWGD